MLPGVTLCLAVVLSAATAVAGERDRFDSGQPFKQLFDHHLLESFVEQAQDILLDHFELSGSLDGEGGQGDHPRSFQFKFYPEGKSKSDRHISAEGRLGPSDNLKRQEFHFDFTFPRSAPEPAPLPDNVL